MADHIDAFDIGRIERKHPFHAFAVTDLADREVLVHAAAVHGDNNTFKGLNPLARAFNDYDVHPDGIAWIEGRNIFSLLEPVHLGCATFFPSVPNEGLSTCLEAFCQTSFLIFVS